MQEPTPSAEGIAAEEAAKGEDEAALFELLFGGNV